MIDLLRISKIDAFEVCYGCDDDHNYYINCCYIRISPRSQNATRGGDKKNAKYPAYARSCLLYTIKRNKILIVWCFVRVLFMRGVFVYIGFIRVFGCLSMSRAFI